MKLEVYDDFFPEELYVKLLAKFENPWVLYGWKSSDTEDPHGHFNHDMTRSTAANLADVSDRLDGEVREAWEYTKSKLGNDLVLLRCYLNAHTYGTEGYYHKDTIIPYKNTVEDSMNTVIVYIHDGVWDKNWGGETAFLQDNDSPIHPSVLPARNRVVIFGSDEWHCARSVSRKYYGFRRTFMFKYRERLSPDLEKLSEFLYKNAAVDVPHAFKSSLHDHLFRVYSLLEGRGLDETTCRIGGLHSVYGTNAFQFKLLESDRDLVKEFGKAVNDFVLLFSEIKRPMQLEKPEEEGDLFVQVIDNNDDVRILNRRTFDTLRYVECANLIDQKMLKQRVYPNLYNLWYQS